MNNNFLEIIKSGRILVSDGAMGTELQKRGMQPGNCPEELNITNPKLIQEIHRDYYNAGSDLVETNSFGGNRARLSLHNNGNLVTEYSIKAAELARAVCPSGKFVAGSVGPTGEFLEPLGTLSVDEAYNIFAEQASALKTGGADIIFVETMMSVEEAEIAVKAAKSAANLPVSASMTFELSSSGLKTMWGVDVLTAVERLTEAGADIIGSNCGRGFDDMIEVIKEMRKLTNKPLLAQANAGMPEIIDGVITYLETPDLIVPKVEQLLLLGVNIIGGCCGTGPEHIKKIKEIVDRIIR